MYNIIDKVINKGVPILTPIIIRHCDLREICEDKEKFDYAIDDAIKRKNEKINKIVPMQNFKIYKSMTIKINPETLQKSIIFSQGALLYSMMKYLNYNHINFNEDIDFDYLNLDFQKILPQIDKLRKINNSHKLKKKFPVLYTEYMNTLTVNQYLLKIEKEVISKVSSNKEKEVLRHHAIEILRKETNGEVSETLFEDAKKFDIKIFCNKFADCFEEIVNNCDIICQILDEETISLDEVSIDKEKIELYLAHRYIESIKDNSDKDKQKYVYYLANYFKENPDRKKLEKPEINIIETDGLNPEIGTNIKETITPKSIYLEFRKFIIDNPKIQLLDFNDVDFSKMTLAEVEVFIEEYLKTFKANWEIIPKDSQMINNEYVYSEKKNIVDYEKLDELFMQKKEFYSSLDPFMCIKGKKTFEGYIGYIFTNGIVVLDKFYENSKTGKVSKGDAIYYMNIQDFYELSRYPKKELMSNPKVKRIIHRGNWQKEILNIINKSGDGMKTSEEIHQLIKIKNIYEDNN